MNSPIFYPTLNYIWILVNKNSFFNTCIYTTSYKRSEKEKKNTHLWRKVKIFNFFPEIQL